jgi:hypothetical protein
MSCGVLANMTLPMKSPLLKNTSLTTAPPSFLWPNVPFLQDKGEQKYHGYS